MTCIIICTLIIFLQNVQTKNSLRREVFKEKTMFYVKYVLYVNDQPATTLETFVTSEALETFLTVLLKIGALILEIKA